MPEIEFYTETALLKMSFLRGHPIWRNLGVQPRDPNQSQIGQMLQPAPKTYDFQPHNRSMGSASSPSRRLVMQGIKKLMFLCSLLIAPSQNWFACSKCLVSWTCLSKLGLRPSFFFKLWVCWVSALLADCSISWLACMPGHHGAQARESSRCCKSACCPTASHSMARTPAVQLLPVERNLMAKAS